MRIATALLMSLVLAAAGAAAQTPAPRSIDDLLNPPVPAPAPPRAPAPVPPPSAGLNVGDANVQPDGSLRASDRDYDNRVLSAFRNAQNNQGPLDGRWLAKAPDGTVYYAFQFTDPGAGADRIEGAWRDPRVSGAGGAGYIDQIADSGGDPVLTFREQGVEHQVRLHANGSGAWSGQLRLAGRTTALLVLRDEGIETAAAEAPDTAGPPPLATPKAKAKAKSKSRSKSKSKSKGSTRLRP